MRRSIAAMSSSSCFVSSRLAGGPRRCCLAARWSPCAEVGAAAEERGGSRPSSDCRTLCATATCSPSTAPAPATARTFTGTIVVVTPLTLLAVERLLLTRGGAGGIQSATSSVVLSLLLALLLLATTACLRGGRSLPSSRPS
eukprot:scaffold7151_cov159-Ochromonas_danica.AAC.1